MEHHKLDNDKQVFFYEQEFYVLSNFSAFKVFWRGIEFYNSEVAYHWSKFNYIADDVYIASLLPIIQQEIIDAKSAHDSYRVAKGYKQYVNPSWKEIDESMMLSILLAKTRQHDYVKRKLLETGDRELIEDSWRDDYWGWGPNKDGQNKLGKLWTIIRDEYVKPGLI